MPLPVRLARNVDGAVFGPAAGMRPQGGPTESKPLPHACVVTALRGPKARSFKDVAYCARTLPDLALAFMNGRLGVTKALGFHQATKRVIGEISGLQTVWQPLNCPKMGFPGLLMPIFQEQYVIYFE